MPLIADSTFRLAAGLAIAALLVTGLVLGRDILMPLACAIILAFMLSPLVSWASARYIPRGIAVGITMAGAVVLIASASLAFSAQLLSLTVELSKYQENMAAKVRSIAGGAAGDNIFRRAARSIESIEQTVAKELNATPTAPAPTPSTAAGPSGGPTSNTLTSLAKALGPLTQFGLTLLIAAFLLVQQYDIRDRIVRVLGTDHMTETTNALGDAGSRLSKFLLLQGVLNASFGCFVTIALFWIGVPNPVLWGIATMFLRFVPFIGSILAALPPILLAVAVDPGWSMALATLAVFAIGEPIMGHVIEPLVLGKGVGLTPIAVIVSASFWAFIWGPVGLVLAAPLTMALVVLAQYSTRLEFLDVLLSDRPALDPFLALYHRLLADDAPAASAQLEKALETRSLPSIADELILPALRLAARDHRLNRLSRQDVADFEATLTEVDRFVIPAAPPADKRRCETDTIVLPARGPVDLLAARTIAAVLESASSCRCSVIEEVSGILALSVARETIADRPGASILISTVGGTDASHLGLLVRRARQECPTARLMVANWGIDGSARPGEVANAVVPLTRLSEAAALLAAAPPAPRPSRKQSSSTSGSESPMDQAAGTVTV